MAEDRKSVPPDTAAPAEADSDKTTTTRAQRAADKAAAEAAAEADAPYAPDASGNDYDSKVRALKHRMAASETSGDTADVDDVRGQLDALRDERDQAAQADVDRDAAAARRREAAAAAARRREAAAAAGPSAATTPPQGRAAPAKAATVANTNPTPQKKN